MMISTAPLQLQCNVGCIAAGQPERKLCIHNCQKARPSSMGLAARTVQHSSRLRNLAALETGMVYAGDALTLREGLVSLATLVVGASR